MENTNQKNNELIKSRGNVYKETKSRAEDAKSSSGALILAGIIGVLVILALWLEIIPLSLAMYMKILYTVILAVLSVVFISTGIYYKKKVGILQSEAAEEEQHTEEIVSWFTDAYSLEALDEMLPEEERSMEQLYFDRYEKISEIISEKYQIQDETYLDYLIEKIFQTYSVTE